MKAETDVLSPGPQIAAGSTSFDAIVFALVFGTFALTL